MAKTWHTVFSRRPLLTAPLTWAYALWQADTKTLLEEPRAELTALHFMKHLLQHGLVDEVRTVQQLLPLFMPPPCMREARLRTHLKCRGSAKSWHCLCRRG